MAFAGLVGVSAGAVLVAEMGDKTQLVAMSLASRYRVRTVLLGSALATVVIHGISVLLAEVLGLALPADWLSLGAGLAFLGFGAWTLRGDELTEADEERAATRRAGSALLTVATIFFLAELGDKTMFTTVAVGADHAGTPLSWLAVWIGSTLGMVAADALGIALGMLLGKKLPEKAIRIGAAVVFFLAGLAMTWQGLSALLF